MITLLTKKQAAAYLGISVRTLERMMHEGTGPRWIQLRPRMIRFRQHDLDAWVESQRDFGSVSEAAKAS